MNVDEDDGLKYDVDGVDDVDDDGVIVMMQPPQ